MSTTINFPKTEYVLLSMPEPHVLLITINRQKQYNALNAGANWELHSIFDWAEQEDSIWSIIVSKKFIPTEKRKRKRLNQTIKIDHR